MTKEQALPAGVTADARRRHRARPTPRWLVSKTDLDAIARSRCLMLLSVLSGEKPVSDAIAEAKISRQTYYHMETKALKALLAVLNPLASVSEQGTPDLTAAAQRISQLEAQVSSLEQDKRRIQRLLLLTRKSLRAPVKTGRVGRPPKSALPGSMPSSSRRSKGSKAKAKSNGSSTPTAAGQAAP